jgi:hypothetical protein
MRIIAMRTKTITDPDGRKRDVRYDMRFFGRVLDGMRFTKIKRSK